MSGATSRELPPKSLADILTEELDGQIGRDCTHEQPVADKQARLKAIYSRIHKEQPHRSALCLSGGGIRSAIFSLGIIQGLAKHRLLGQFDYLATVSGGGYVGGWLSAWIKNHSEGASGVVDALASPPESALNPEPQPVRHLRAFSNYLTPRTGFTSADTWTLVATFLRNMFLNWFILMSWLAAATLIPRFYLAAITAAPDWSQTHTDAQAEEVLQYWDVILNSLLVVGFGLIAIAMAYAIVDVPSTGNARFPQRRFLCWRQLPLFLAALVLCEWWALQINVHGNKEFLSARGAFIGFTILSYLAGGFLGWLGTRWLKLRKVKLTGKARIVSTLRRVGAVLAVTSLAGLAFWTIAARIFPVPAKSAINYACFAPALFLAVLLVVNFLFTGLASRASQDEDREWWGRSAGWLLITICAWVMINVVVLWGAQLITSDSSNDVNVFLGKIQSNSLAKGVLGIFGGMSGLVGALLALRAKFARKSGSGRRSRWPLVLAAVLFFVLLSVLVSWLLLFLGSQRWVQQTGKWLLGANEYQGQLVGISLISVGLLLCGIVMGYFIDVNKFSLHATYRSRLVRAFLGASRTPKPRKPHRFTGFDPADDIALSDLRPEKPFHVIVAALNLIKGKQLAWQERKAESFTMSRLHCGSWHVGYRPSDRYGDKIKLGTALTISGAAANPNMGYYSSPIVGFFMALFNVRLGWWLGNPGSPGARTWKLAGPGYAVGPLFSEAIGQSTDSYKYVNLSDGGHFENLGLYEMVLRRCKHILVVDAGQDFDYVFEDLGNAIRKIRIDLGIPIEIKVASPKKEEDTINHCAFGTIRYSVMDGPGTDGSLIYVKPVVSGDEPPDVSNYAAAHPEFPHEPTSDQWFSESQLESYRLLGLHAVEVICGESWKEKTLPDFFVQVHKSLSRRPEESAT